MDFITLLIAWFASAVAFWITAVILPGFKIEKGLGGAAIVALIFGILQLVAGWLLPAAIAGAPSMKLSLGSLIQWLTVTLLLMLTDKFSKALKIDNFWWAALGAVLVTIGSRLIDSGIHYLIQMV